MLRRSRNRLLLLASLLPLLLIGAALLYMAGMAGLEGRPRGFLQALQWAAGAVSTTGYGPDSQWHHPLMVLFAVVMQFVGVFLIFFVFPIYLLPFLEERFEARLPTAAEGLAGHLVIVGAGPAIETLLAEADRLGVPVLLVESDEAEARRLLDLGRRVVLGRLEDGVLRRVCLERARAVVANGTDDQNAAVVLDVRHAGFSGDAIALVEEPFHRQPMVLAGATAAYTPRHILGAALAAHASRKLRPAAIEAEQLGDRLQVAEVRIGSRSELAGRALAEAAVTAKTGAIVLGQWLGGRLEAPPAVDMRLESGRTLVAAGSPESLQRLAELAREDSGASGAFVIGGYGEVGQKVAELLRDVGETVVVVDRRALPGVDHVGNMLDHALLAELPLAGAQAIVLALESDSATVFATVILKELAPQTPIIARVNRAENVEKIHRAGADFALSISQVAGQMLAKRLLGEDVVEVDPSLRVQRLPARRLAGKTVGEALRHELSDCFLLAVERGSPGGELVVGPPPELRLAPRDQIYVCGRADAVRRLGERLAAA